MKKFIPLFILNLPALIFNVIYLIYCLIILIPIYLTTKDEKIKQYIENQFMSLDQAINTWAGGSVDETISSRLGRNYPDTWLAKFVNILFRWQSDNHCGNAIEWDEDESDAVLKNK